jgi:nitrate reductase NapE component
MGKLILILVLLPLLALGFEGSTGFGGGGDCNGA